MENLARSEYDFDADKKVKEELQIAGIPAIRLGVIENEVKTHYIGILNGFFSSFFFNSLFGSFIVVDYFLLYLSESQFNWTSTIGVKKRVGELSTWLDVTYLI